MILPFPVTGVEAGVVEEAGSVSVYEGAEGEAVSPAGGHVPDVEAGVGGQLPPAPLLQGRRPQHSHGSPTLDNVCINVQWPVSDCDLVRVSASPH